jgi:hypothetical protein
MKDNARDIARLVVLAQDASDAGKGSSYLEIRDRGARFTQEAGYFAKNKYIQLALKRISTCKPCGWNFYVNKEDDQNGYPSVLTYFQYRANGKRYDICFHTPFYQAEHMIGEFIGKGRRTHWNGIIGGSRRDCQSLIDLFNL